MTAPPTNAPVGTSDDTSLRTNSLGVLGVTMTVVSAAAPLTVMAGVAPVALAVGGVGVPSAYLLAGVVLTVFAIGFTAMASSIPRTGGFFVYIGHAFGGTAGFAAAVVAIVSYNCLQIGVYGLFGVQTQAALQDLFGLDVPWPVITVVAVVAVYLLGIRGIDLGARVLTVLIVLEAGILSLLALAIVFQGGADGLGVASFDPSNVFTEGTMATIGICFAAFMGFESTALYRAEAKDARRTIPRATFLAVAFMGLFYCFVVWTIVQALGQDNVEAGAGEAGPALFFTTINTYLGPWAEHAMYVLVVTSVYASQLAFHHAINRYVHGMARHGALPAAFARTNRAGSPVVAGTVQTVLALVVVLGFAAFGADPFTDLLIGVNTPGVVGVVLLQAVASLAAVRFFLRHRDVPRRPLVIGSSVLAAVLMLLVIWQFLDHIAVFTGAPPEMNRVLVSVIPVVVVLAVVAGLVMRRVRPDVIAELAHEGEDEEVVR
ncbi:APC family permease [Aeromicrobium sp. IC_218]|uniref:APC family permease n=1 Tax=Aeromicrobium sp. IC_218 TaxID=2545468 RepID=UPI00103C2EF7|nr:APC family permease [Aeromicrobium sp. IC_218]TCI98840.1 APC family permease [Aeromicrobium sp. IC_218]